MHYRLQTLSYLISICNPVRANEIKMNFNQVYMIYLFVLFIEVSPLVFHTGHDPIHSALGELSYNSIQGFHPAYVPFQDIPYAETIGINARSKRTLVCRCLGTDPRVPSHDPLKFSVKSGESPDSRSKKWITLSSFCQYFGTATLGPQFTLN